MAVEIERKFLLTSESWRGLAKSTHYRQGYLCSSPGLTVRVRIAGEQGFLTIKGETAGIGRNEYEYEIPLGQARELLDTLCAQPQIEKKRYIIPYRGFTWEVDEFLGANKGLIVAEVELEHEEQPFERPDWIGQEVTGDPRYYNACLCVTPYTAWPEDDRLGR